MGPGGGLVAAKDNKLREVDELTFWKFIKEYPRKLERDMYRIGEPPTQCYYDFVRGDWRESLVASIFLESFCDSDKPDIFRIMKDEFLEDYDVVRKEQEAIAIKDMEDQIAAAGVTYDALAGKVTGDGKSGQKLVLLDPMTPMIAASRWRCAPGGK